VKENQQNMNRIVWDGTNDAGMKMPSGNYFIEIKAKNKKAVSKILLIR
jgi:flagellar hook assembly protein FlgD